jgi:hypothetical protein
MEKLWVEKVFLHAMQWKRGMLPRAFVVKEPWLRYQALPVQFSGI